MARTVSVPEQDYLPGTYGPFVLNNFLSNNTDWLELVLTNVNWPTAQTLITGQLRWDTGDGMDFSITSPPMSRLGAILPEARVRVEVPKVASGKAAVTSATVTFTATQALRTAVTATAGAD